jgi:hypothetical protein
LDGSGPIYILKALGCKGMADDKEKGKRQKAKGKNEDKGCFEGGYAGNSWVMGIP